MVDRLANKTRLDIYYNAVLNFIIKKQVSISQEVHKSKYSLYYFDFILLLALHDHIYK